MRRTQIYLEDGQRRKLDQVARRTHRTVSDLIREAIDDRFASPPGQDFIEALRGGTFVVWRERSDIGATGDYVRRVRRGRRVTRLLP